MTSNAKSKDEEHVIGTVNPGTLQVDKTSMQQKYHGNLDETDDGYPSQWKSNHEIPPIS